MSFRVRMSVVAVVTLLVGGAVGVNAASPSPSVAPAASPGWVPAASPTPVDGEIVPGHYVTAQGAWTPVTFSYAIAAPGWFAQNGGQTITKWVDDSAREISWSVEILDSLFATPCGTDALLPLGPTVEDLVGGLQALPDLDVSPSREWTVDGRAGQTVDLSLPDGLDEASCDPPIGVQVWLDQAGGKYLVVGDALTSRVHTVDVDGERFVLNANIAKTADPVDITEFEAIVDSITFGP